MGIRCKLGICNTNILIHDGLSETTSGDMVFATTKECQRCHRQANATWPIERQKEWLKENGLDSRFVNLKLTNKT